MNNKTNYLLILFLVISLAGNILFYFKIGALENEIKKISQNEDQPITTAKDTAKNEDNNITYTTFSSPKADFTFEYPSNWIYKEENTENTNVWTFTGDVVLEVHSPSYEVFDSCSVGYKGTKTPYQLNIFPTNDPETFVTYEQCGSEYGSGYIYWQKGEYFANASLIDDIQKINLIIFDSGIWNKKNLEVVQHIAQSIKIK